jgi:hypothetical protein
LEAILLEEEPVSLENVTVSASNLSSLIDKKIIYPSERQVSASTSEVDILQQLMLPKLQINPLFNEVSLPGGGELQYRINGVKVEAQDIIALQSAEIIRLKFHDNPGLRYGNAGCVHWEKPVHQVERKKKNGLRRWHGHTLINQVCSGRR